MTPAADEYVIRSQMVRLQVDRLHDESQKLHEAATIAARQGRMDEAEALIEQMRAKAAEMDLCLENLRLIREEQLLDALRAESSPRKPWWKFWRRKPNA